MEVTVWALKVLLAGLMLMPIIGATGCAWISHWWSKHFEYNKKWVEFQMAVSNQIREQSGKNG